jgi:hypothetical protein
MSATGWNKLKRCRSCITARCTATSRTKWETGRSFTFDSAQLRHFPRLSLASLSHGSLGHTASPSLSMMSPFALPCRPARIHDVFHVGLLKKFQGTPPADPPALSPLHHGAVAPEPARVVRYRLARGVRQVLVQWKGESAASATWEDVESFCAKYPAFQLEDELVLEGGRDVMVGRTYSRHRRARDVRRDAERAERTISDS